VKHYGLKLALLAAFALTLGLKLLLHDHGQTAAPERLGEAVAAFLAQHGFEPRVEKSFGHVLVYANSGKCRMLISKAEAHGWDRSSIEMKAQSMGRLNYVFDGALYEHEPYLAPVINEYWTHLRNKLGLIPNYHPVLAVAASDDCAINSLPWWEIGMIT
jgi:hypothetical protein